MSNLPIAKALIPEAIEKVLISGNLRDLRPEERVSLYNALCDSLGFNKLTRPFDYVEFQGKLVLYLNKGGAEQLRHIHKVSIEELRTEKLGDVYIVIAKAQLPDGRKDQSTGALDLKGLSGERLANAIMKTETKAKRRVSISICGLNMLDESEVDSIDGAKRLSHEEVERDVTPPTNAAQNEESQSQASAPRKQEARLNTQAKQNDPLAYVFTFKGQYYNWTLGEALAEDGQATVERYLYKLLKEAKDKGYDRLGPWQIGFQMALSRHTKRQYSLNDKEADEQPDLHGDWEDTAYSAAKAVKS